MDRVLLKLSPSSATDFKSCAQLFKFRSVDRIPEPATPASARGSLVHAVLERLFTEPAPTRTIVREREVVDNLIPVPPRAWYQDPTIWVAAALAGAILVVLGMLVARATSDPELPTPVPAPTGQTQTIVPPAQPPAQAPAPNVIVVPQQQQQQPAASPQPVQTPEPVATPQLVVTPQPAVTPEPVATPLS